MLATTLGVAEELRAMFERRSPGTVTALLFLLVLITAGCAGAVPATPVPAAPIGDSAGRADDEFSREPSADADSGVRDGALIVYSGRMRLEVADVGPAVEAATRLIVDLGGYVAGSQAESATSSESATITFRIPAARWQEALSGLREQAQRVVSEFTESADVTAEVVDLDARLTNLRATEAALQEIMVRAETIEDVLKVQRELTTVRGQIEQLTGQRDHLLRQAAHGTLVVYFATPLAAATVAQEGWQLSAEVDRAIADLIRIAQRLTSAAIWLTIVVAPVVLPVGVVLLVAYRLRRRFLPGAPSGPTT
jgi:hypothetical protein